MTYSKQREDFFNPPSAEPSLPQSNDSIDVKVMRLHEDAVIPKYARDGDAGFDLVAVEDTIIEPGETRVIPTGLAIELPLGYEMQIRPRSGITAKTKLRVQLGTVDSGFRGEVGVIVDNINTVTDVPYEYLFNTADNLVNVRDVLDEWDVFEKGSYIIRKGDRIAQAVINRIPSVQITEVGELGESERGGGGFGSTGVRGDT